MAINQPTELSPNCLVRDILAEYLPLDGCHRVDVERKLRRVRIRYQATTDPLRSDERRTMLELEGSEGTGEMWVGMLHVAPSLRGQGLGKTLAKAAEAVAQALSMKRIHVLPYPQADAFWRRLGYLPHDTTCRVRTKHLAPETKLSAANQHGWPTFSHRS